MTVPKITIWPLDPHTLAKHEILKRYLQRWFPILNKYHGKIIYVDGFCGPGRYSQGEPGSPLIALDVAANHRKSLSGEIVFLFIDERDDRIKHLKRELENIAIPAHFEVIPHCGEFQEKLKQLLDNLDEEKGTLPPTFVFIDPFGFSGLPFALVERLLKKTRCEVLVTFMVDSINRFLEHPDPKIVKHIDELLGSKDCVERALKSSDRIGTLRDIYQAQLKTVAKFIRYFEMRDSDNRVQYLLFFASNHPLGHVKMKEAMWAINPEGHFKFSDATNREQRVLFESDYTISLWLILCERYAGQEISTDRILDFVNDETPFLGTHMKSTLKKHLVEPDRISVRQMKADGTKWIRGSFPPGVYVTFPSKA